MKAIFLSKAGKTSSPMASPDIKFYTHDLKSKVESKFRTTVRPDLPDVLLLELA